MKKYLWGIFGLLVIVAGVSGNNETNTIDNAALAAVTSSPVNTISTTVLPTPNTTVEQTMPLVQTSSINSGEATPVSSTAKTIPPTSTATTTSTKTPAPSVTAKIVVTQTPKASNSTQNNTYTNVDGQKVKSPVQADQAPNGATAQCKDGSYSFSQNRRGTCSGHGGVADWL